MAARPSHWAGSVGPLFFFLFVFLSADEDVAAAAVTVDTREPAKHCCASAAS